MEPTNSLVEGKRFKSDIPSLLLKKEGGDVTEVLSYIISLLPPKDVAIVSAASRFFHDLAEEYWKRLSEQEQLAFDWSVCEGRLSPFKARYCLNRGLFKFFKRIKSQAEDFASSQKAYHDFKPLMDSFPHFKAYCLQELSRISKTRISTVEPEELFIKASEDKWGGETLLHGLFKRSRHSLHYFKKAVELKATIASYIAVEMLSKKISFEELFLLSKQAADHGDWRGMQRLLERQCKYPSFSQTLQELQAEHKYPPLCYYLAREKLKAGDTKATIEFLDKAIAGYGHRIPKLVLTEIVEMQLQLNRWPHASELSSKAIEAYGNHVPAHVLANAALAEYKLQYHCKAVELYDKAIEAYGNHVPAHVLANAALVKYELQYYCKAAELYDKAIQAYGNHAPADVLANAALAKREFLRLNHMIFKIISSFEQLDKELAKGEQQ